MRRTAPRDRVKTLAVALLTSMVTLFAQDNAPVPYPDGFRSWAHVKSLIIGPDHESFSKRGGIHHYYANGKAVAGYRTGIFPEGSILVDEAVFTKDARGAHQGPVRGRSGHVLLLPRKGANRPRLQSDAAVTHLP